MKKITNNQSGFSAVELILIILVVGLLGTVGYLVYKNQKKTPATTTTASVTASATKSPTTPALDPYAGWKTYKNQNLFVGFDYPASWKVSTKEVKMDTTSNYVYVESPDFVAADTQSAIPTPKTGAAFSVYISPNKFGWKSVAEATKNIPGFSDPKNVKIDGLDGVTGAPSYNSITTRVLRSENYVDLSYYYVQDKKDANLSDYQHWLSTVKLSESSFPVGN
jgi:Tfp pilus assembly protein PilE